MRYPTEVIEAVDAAIAAHAGGVAEAVEAAVAAVRALPDYRSFVNGLVHNAVMSLVHDRRHQANTKIKREMGFYGGPPKVETATSAGVAAAAESVYQYRVAGRVLGDLLGGELAPLADAEEGRGRGCLVNAAVLRWCAAQRVPEGEAVRDHVSERRLAAAFRRLLRAGQGDAPGARAA